jgi:ribonuclease-3
MRQRLVNEQALAEISRSISLGDHLFLGNAFFLEGGADQDSVLADAMEAVLAAVYLDGGFEAARQVILALWDVSLIKQTDAGLDAKGALQAYLQAKGETEPDYRDVSEFGPAHKRIFTAAVFHKGRELAQAQGKTKRIAQQQAAEKALLILKSREGSDETDQA